MPGWLCQVLLAYGSCMYTHNFISIFACLWGHKAFVERRRLCTHRFAPFPTAPLTNRLAAALVQQHNGARLSKRGATATATVGRQERREGLLCDSSRKPGASLPPDRSMHACISRALRCCTIAHIHRSLSACSTALRRGGLLRDPCDGPRPLLVMRAMRRAEASGAVGCLWGGEREFGCFPRPSQTTSDRDSLCPYSAPNTHTCLHCALLASSDPTERDMGVTGGAAGERLQGAGAGPDARAGGRAGGSGAGAAVARLLRGAGATALVHGGGGASALLWACVCPRGGACVRGRRCLNVMRLFFARQNEGTTNPR